VRRILCQTTYIGRHVFNRCDGTGKEKPIDEWIIVSVPPIIDEATFYALQAAFRKGRGGSE
jgi:site-specific DNA recombinase